MKRILSIDGGGIRGIIPALICEALEDKTGQQISSLFDLITGTSTGGILGLGLASGKPASQLVRFYLDKGPIVFARPLNVLRQKLRPKFRNFELRKAVENLFGGTMLSQAETEVLITAYNIRSRTPAYFSRHGAKEKSTWDYSMVAVAMATSAAPTYFPPFEINGEFYVDGAIVANNPACVAYAHAKKLWPKEDIILLSIGTGYLAPPLPAPESTRWGELKWARPVIDCFMDGTSQATDDFFTRIHPNSYLRLQGGLASFTKELDGVTPESMQGLKNVAMKVLSDNRWAMEEFLRKIKELRDLEVSKRLIQASITSPRDMRIGYGKIRIEGKVSNYTDEQYLYAFTGAGGRYLPSSRVSPLNGSWSTILDVGFSGTEATITVASVNKQLADYIDFYLEYAHQINSPGIRVREVGMVLDEVRVRLSPTP